VDLEKLQKAQEKFEKKDEFSLKIKPKEMEELLKKRRISTRNVPKKNYYVPDKDDDERDPKHLKK
jgi:hypothetical protein